MLLTYSSIDITLPAVAQVNCTVIAVTLGLITVILITIIMEGAKVALKVQRSDLGRIGCTLTVRTLRQ